ncbi:MAG: response regulator [Opitutae bacterium]|nr:response regulator [Opitutae bacterium]
MSLPTLTFGAAAVVPRTRHILYADDMHELRRLLEVTLGRDGHTVETAADGREALERIAAAPAAFDLLITDHHMPRLNGLELVARLRTLPFAGKIIVFSSELGEEVAGAYRRLQVEYILPKPIFPETLRMLLTTL